MEQPRERFTAADVTAAPKQFEFHGEIYKVSRYITAFGEIVTKNDDVLRMLTENTVLKLNDLFNRIVKDDPRFRNFDSYPQLHTKYKV
jgi:hypothetical protein